MRELVISDDEGRTTVVPLIRDEITIGRAEGNTIRLTERNVSRKHAKLLGRDDDLTIQDLSSYNGVVVNGRKIDGHTRLTTGDQIQIGDYLLALNPGAAAKKAATAPPSDASADAPTAMIAAPVGLPARLVMLSAPAPGAEFALRRGSLRLGRAEDLDAWINHRSISREHAEVIRRDDRTWEIVDLGSANGVRVNGQEITSAPLRSGDMVDLGQVRFRFVAEGEPYVFDADRTVQMAPAVLDGEGMPKAPILAALGIVGAAVAVAAIFALTGDPEPTTRAPFGIEQPVDEPRRGTEPTPPPAPAAAPAAEAAPPADLDAIEESEEAVDPEPDVDEPPPRRARAREPRTSRTRPPERSTRISAEPRAPAPAAPPPRERCEVTSPDYSTCLVRTIEPRASSASMPELALLIETYRTLGNSGAAYRYMRLFIRRFGSSPRAQSYRQILVSKNIPFDE
jgi:pSer/pThr/pTyr-binding forkhead associated (FHA) protein